jgi:hypothetical protein
MTGPTTGHASPLLVAKTPERCRFPAPFVGLGNPLASPLLPAFFSPGGCAHLFSSPLPLFHPSPLSKRGAAMSPSRQQPFSPGQFNYDAIFKSPLNVGVRGDPLLGTPGADQLGDQLLWKLDTPRSKALFMGGDFMSPSPLRGGGRPGGEAEGSSGRAKAPFWGQDDALPGRSSRLEGEGRGAALLPGAEELAEEHADDLRSALASPAGKVRRASGGAPAVCPASRDAGRCHAPFALGAETCLQHAPGARLCAETLPSVPGPNLAVPPRHAGHRVGRQAAHAAQAAGHLQERPVAAQVPGLWRGGGRWPARLGGRRRRRDGRTLPAGWARAWQLGLWLCS